MLENLPIELHWNIIKFLRHPVAEIFVQQPCYQDYLSTTGDTYEDEEINDLIPFYDVWRIWKIKPHKCLWRVIVPLIP
jgi:hypothetical protein